MRNNRDHCWRCQRFSAYLYLYFDQYFNSKKEQLSFIHMLYMFYPQGVKDFMHFYSITLCISRLQNALLYA